MESDRSRWATVALAFLIAIFEGVDIQAAGLAAPQVRIAFHLSTGQLSWFFAASSVGLIVGAVAGGRLADLAGRKSALLGGVFVFGLSSLASAYSPDFTWLAAARLLTGVGLGGALPNLIAIAAEHAPGNRAKLAVSAVYSGTPLGGGLAALLLSLTDLLSDWRVIFEIGGFAPLALVPLALCILPNAGAARQADTAVPTPPIRALLSGRRLIQTPILWAGFFCALLILYLLLNWLPTLLVARGLSRSEAAMAQAIFNLVGVAGAIVVGALIERWLRWWSVALVYTVLGASLAALTAASGNLRLTMACVAVVGAATIGAQVVFYSLAPGVYPQTSRGTGVGAAVAAGRVGSITGPLFAGLLIGRGGDADQVLLGLLPIVGVAGILGIVLARLSDAGPRGGRSDRWD